MKNPELCTIALLKLLAPKEGWEFWAAQGPQHAGWVAEGIEEDAAKTQRVLELSAEVEDREVRVVMPASFVAALQEEWLPDARVVAVMPFLLTSLGVGGGQFTQKGWDWVMMSPRPPSATLQYNATRALRCMVGVGGHCP